MMEGVSHEAASFAGMQKLGKLICVYDDNGISIDGKVKGWFTDNTAMRFEAYGWHVIPHVDGQDSGAVAEALSAARAVTDKPSLICAKTTIGWGAPNKQGTAAMHGEAMGNEEIAAEAVRSAQGKGCKVRLVSMPSTTTFDRQDQAYKDSVLPPTKELFKHYGFTPEHVLRAIDEVLAD
jgi:transketolase